LKELGGKSKLDFPVHSIISFWNKRIVKLGEDDLVTSFYQLINYEVLF
jgi:hypothetical protein